MYQFTVLTSQNDLANSYFADPGVLKSFCSGMFYKDYSCEV
jgi:hypothetical protein